MAQNTPQLTGVLRLSLPDIARLTQVQRPVVSAWRTRSKNSPHPFPAAIATERGQEWFEAAEIVDWLELTGRGNNPSARADVVAFGSLEGGSPFDDEPVFMGLTALLCLAAVGGQSLQDKGSAEILDLADESDPDDDCLLSEIEALGERLDGLIRYAGLLVNAAYSAASAFEKMMTERFRLHVPGQSTAALSAPTLDLVATVALGMADQSGFDMPTFVDPTGGGSDLLIALSARAEDPRVLSVATAPGADPASRLARRRLWIHDLHRVPLVADDAGGYLMPESAVVLAQYPWPGAPAMSNLQILEAVNDLALQTNESHRVVVIAPAAALTDELHLVEEKRVRDGLLRTDRMRALVRLPPGSVTTKPNQRMAMCCLGSASLEAADDGTTLVGDLATVTLDAMTIDGLVTEVLAGMTGQRRFRRSAAQLLRPALQRTLRARTQGLIDPAPRLQPTAGLRGSEMALQIENLNRILQEPIPVAMHPVVEVREAEHLTGWVTTLMAAMVGKEIRFLSGLRMDAAHVTTGSGAAIVGYPELTGAAGRGARRIDRITFAQHYPRGSYTEPGDVIFWAGTPLAMLDAEGGSVVESPARVARVNKTRATGILPRVLVADINAAASGSSRWRNWTVRVVPDDQMAALDDALSDIDDERTHLESRISQLKELAHLLTQGTASGTIAITDNKAVAAKGK